MRELIIFIYFERFLEEYASYEMLLRCVTPFKKHANLPNRNLFSFHFAEVESPKYSRWVDDVFSITGS